MFRAAFRLSLVSVELIALCIVTPTKSQAQLTAIWQDTFSLPGYGVHPQQLRIDRTGRVYAAGEAVGTVGEKAVTLVCYDSLGVELWSTYYPCGLVENCDATDLEIDSSGNSYLSGNVGAYYNPVASFVMSYDPSGQVRWQRGDTMQCGSIDRITAEAIALDAAGSLYMVGTVECDTLPFPNWNLVLTKLTQNGVFVWRQSWINPVGYFATGYDVAVGPDGNVYATGYADPSTDPHEYGTPLTLSYDSSGTIRWFNILRLTGDIIIETGRFVMVDDDVTVCVAANVREIFQFAEHATVLRYSSTGQLFCMDELGPSGAYNIRPTSMFVSSNGQAFIAADLSWGTSGACLSGASEADCDTNWADLDSCAFNVNTFKIGIAGDAYDNIYAWSGTSVRGLTLTGTGIWEDFVSDPVHEVVAGTDRTIVISSQAGNSTTGFAVTIAKHMICACPCIGDPFCDGTIYNAVDVVTIINVAFRGASATNSSYCPFLSTDVDCNGATTAVDVVRVVDVAFRGANPSGFNCFTCPADP